VVTGCPTCRKKFGTMPRFLDHLTDDVLPAALGQLRGSVNGMVRRRTLEVVKCGGKEGSHETTSARH
jgi:hypothetical protein